MKSQEVLKSFLYKNLPGQLWDTVFAQLPQYYWLRYLLDSSPVYVRCLQPKK